MALTKGFRLNSAVTPLDYRMATQGMLARTAAGTPRQGVLHAPSADGNVLTRSASALQVTLLDQVVLALARATAGTDGVDVLTNVGALNLALNAPTANSWYATIWARQNDNTGAGGLADADSLPRLDVTYGAASATPSIPAAPTGATKVGHILIPSGAANAQAAGVVYTETIPHTAPMGSAIRYRTKAAMDADVANLADGALGYVRSGDLYFLKNGVWKNLSRTTPFAEYARVSAFNLSNTKGPMPWNSKVEDATGLVTLAGQTVFTVTEDGLYALDAVVSFVANNTWLNITLVKNGVDAVTVGAPRVTANTEAVSLSKVVRFKAGDTFQIDLQSSATVTGAPTNGNGQATYLTLAKIGE